MKIKIGDSYLDINDTFNKQLVYKKNYSALFNGIDCVVTLSKHGFFRKEDNLQIEFEDNMDKEKYQEIKQCLFEEYGDPIYYASDKGFVWKEKDKYLSFGYVQIEYNVEVLMIIIQKHLICSEKIQYSYYKQVYDVFKKHGLADYLCSWSKYTGFIVQKTINTLYLLINYKNNKLTIYKCKLEKIEAKSEKVIPSSKTTKIVKTIEELDKELENIRFE